MQLTTTRLRLEPYTLAHYDGLRAIDSDAEMMRYLNDGIPKTPEETMESIERVMLRWQQRGFSWWAVIEKASGVVAGAACLQYLANEENAPLEIGWRLNANYHGKGYATEAARAIIAFAVDHIGARYLVSVAHPQNSASHRVMQRLGMAYKGIEHHYDQSCVVYELHLAQA